MQQIVEETDAWTIDMREIDGARIFDRAVPAFFVLNPMLRIVAQHNGSDQSSLNEFVDDETSRFLPPFEQSIRETISRIEFDGGAQQVVMMPSAWALTIFGLNGTAGQWIGVTVQPVRNRDSLARAASKFGLTRREVDVLALILDGAAAPDIAERLNIAEATVQGYFKQLLSKTDARSRATMVAKVLNWQTREFHPPRKQAI